MAERVAVVGAGIVGLATAWALERRGLRCVVYEQGAPGGGQSAGESRIFRHSHGDPREFELALRARRGWRRWEEEFGVQLISPDGVMAIGERAIAMLARYAHDPGIEVRELSPPEIRQALPPLADLDGPVLIDEAAGAIRSRLALAGLIGAASPNLVPSRVERVETLPEGGVRVASASGTEAFDAAVIAAGTGTAGLAAEAELPIPVGTRAHVRMTLPVSADGRPVDRLACFHDSSGAFGETTAYGSPVRGNREYAVGLALDAGSEGEDGLATQAVRTRRYLGRALPGLDLARSQAAHCWITELPWAADGLGIWQRGDAYFVAGHNLFKFAPALGGALARSVVAGAVEPGFRPEDRLGEPVSEPAGSTG